MRSRSACVASIRPTESIQSLLKAEFLAALFRRENIGKDYTAAAVEFASERFPLAFLGTRPTKLTRR